VTRWIGVKQSYMWPDVFIDSAYAGKLIETSKVILHAHVNRMALTALIRIMFRGLDTRWNYSVNVVALNRKRKRQFGVMQLVVCKCKEACRALCYMKLHLVALRHGPRLMGSHRLTCYPHVLYLVIYIRNLQQQSPTVY